MKISLLAKVILQNAHLYLTNPFRSILHLKYIIKTLLVFGFDLINVKNPTVSLEQIKLKLQKTSPRDAYDSDNLITCDFVADQPQDFHILSRRLRVRSHLLKLETRIVSLLNFVFIRIV